MPALSQVAAALAEPFTDPASRTFWGGLLVAAVVASWFSRADVRGGLRREWARWRSPSSRLDIQLLAARQLLRLAGALPDITLAWWLATMLTRRLDSWLGAPGLAAPAIAVSVAYSAILFIAWDLSRYVL